MNSFDFFIKYGYSGSEANCFNILINLIEFIGSMSDILICLLKCSSNCFDV